MGGGEGFINFFRTTVAAVDVWAFGRWEARGAGLAVRARTGAHSPSGHGAGRHSAAHDWYCRVDTLRVRAGRHLAQRGMRTDGRVATVEGAAHGPSRMP